MTETRIAKLLREAAKCFDEASSPFTSEWLSENDVSSGECIDLSTAIATAIRVFLELPNAERMKYTILSLDDLPAELKNSVALQIDMDNTLRKLKAWRPKGETK